MPYEYDSEGNATWTPDPGVDYAPEIDTSSPNQVNSPWYDDSVYEIHNNAATESDPGWGWKYFSDGTVISPTNQYFATSKDPSSTNFASLIYDPANPSGGTFGSLVKSLGTSAANAVKGMFTDPKTGAVSWGNVAAAAGALLGGIGTLGSSTPQKTGYQGGIPELTAVREQVPETYDPTRRAGSGGQKYFTDTKFVKPAETATATAAAREQAAGIQALNKANPARENVASTQSTENLAKGGIAGISTAKQGTYLSGASDGMADKIPANIDGKQEARLSHGEFVVPADVVSHLGNGNSDAGADRLYAMMDRVRKARTGTKKQGKQINPNKYLMA
jgi:hypothetical protein